MLDAGSRFQNRPQSNRNREVYYAQVLEEVGDPSRGEVKAECREREAGPGAHAFISVLVFFLGVSGLASDWSIRT